MRVNTTLTARIFQVLFYGLCVLYIIFYMPYGLEGTDTGYIFGSSWNIYNGELPHRDFIYTRPAIPAFFHTIFLFISETYGYVLDRSFFYIQVFFYSFLGAKLLTEHFSIESKTTLYYLAIIGALVSIHNYPPMGWNTIDGIFFWMIGIFLFLKLKTSKLALFFGVLFMILGTFSKQSFYFMPFFLGLYLLLTKDWYRLKYYILFGVLWLGLYIGFKALTGSLTPLLEQTFTRTEGGSLYSAGVRSYWLAVKFNYAYIALAIFMALMGLFLGKRKLGYLVLNIIIITAFISMYQQEDSIRVVKSSLLQVLFIIAVIHGLFMLRKNTKYLLLFLLLSLSWSASISGGFKTPILFSLPIVFGLYDLYFTKDRSENKITYSVYGLTIIGFLVTFFIGYQTIYRDSDREQLTYSMGEIFPQLTTIKSDQETYEKYTELKELASEYSNFTVLPTVTLAHYLTKTVNPIGTDWPHDVEINYKAKDLFSELKAKNSVVFIEKTEFSEKDFMDYELLKLVKANWYLIEETNQFEVYSPSLKR
ncbi:hypothetical protein ACFQO1_12060 [Jejudonia soesokkakensis]|uniref:Glycosyltransferase RgtA/B/C/D-like domain-containing protein n=1 Tax=Jejudonia soesokkakensis TaxID=1323432 RepID=A0ABW2MXU3_9FLAO